MYVASKKDRAKQAVVDQLGELRTARGVDYPHLRGPDISRLSTNALTDLTNLITFLRADQGR